MIDPNAYGRALFMLAEERGTTETVRADLLAVRDALADNPSYLTLMDTPAVSLAEKEGLIERAFAGCEGDVRSFLKLLAGRHALHTFAAACRHFMALHEQARGIIRAEAVTAVPMREQQQARLQKALQRMTGKQVILTTVVDPAVLGGVKLRYLGKQIDATLATRLSALEDAVRHTIV